MVETFFVRPSFGPTRHPLIELGAVTDASRTLERIGAVVQRVLGAQPSDHLGDLPLHALLTDDIISPWRYPGGTFEVHADSWGLVHVIAPGSPEAVIADIARALDASEWFQQIEPLPR